MLQTERIFINSGARTYIPEIPGLDQVDYLMNSGMMEVDYLPEHPVIIGGSYIGPEFAHTSSSSRAVWICTPSHPDR